ncbi:MAG TPA: beta-ketoacyl-[acyl-carrier-protein] synthase family protein [Candidatus Angelobacter sp.]|nr:beta-ketoacyl-[acyl-carrier-protein] synthase family protein [Candidatus Angelobacter sp.]
MTKRVAITGMGVITSLGDSPQALHSALCKGEQASYRLEHGKLNDVTCTQGGSIGSFQPESYLNSKSLRPLDRTGRIVAAAAKLALANSGWTAERLGNHDIGLVLGTMFGSAHTISEFDRRGLTQGPACVSPLDFANTVLNAAAGQTAIWHNLRGINSTVACGSSSGLMALGYAADLVRYRGQTAILAGGADEFCFESFCGFERAGLLCKTNGHEGLPVPFAAARNGFALGEAVALVMLEERESALARGATILGEIRGHGNAYDPGGRRECGPAAIARAMAVAVDDSGLRPSDIGCISASANGSVFSDRNEALAVKAFFNGGGDAIPITAIKSMLGESLGAAGALQAVDLVETMRTQTLPGIRGLEETSPELPELSFCRKSRDMDVNCGLVNSVGFDGNSSALVITRG